MITSPIQKPNFFVYKASAGAGKTYNLALRYIRICIEQFEKDKYAFRKILAITFTNKAVEEMKERILKFLEILAEPVSEPVSEPINNNNAKLENQTASESGKIARSASSRKMELIENMRLEKTLSEKEISRRSHFILKSILENYSQFSIMTIDKFYQLIISTYAFELQIPANYQLELDEKTFMQQMVDLLLSQLGEEDKKELTGFVLNFMQQRIADGKHWKVEKALAEMGKQLYSDEAFHYLNSLWTNKTPQNNLEEFKNLIKELKSTIGITDNEIKAKAEHLIKLIPDTVDLKKDFAHGSSGFGNWLLQIKENGMKKAAHSNSYIKAAVEENKWVAAKASANARLAILSLAPSLSDTYREIQQIVEKQGKTYFLYLNILKNIYPFALLNELHQISEIIKESEHQMMIGETNRQIAKVVTSEDVPFIYEHLGEKYRYYFIDEFQDTSFLQWNNLLPLVAESLSKEEEGEIGNTFLFGDPKQAIYRFRSGDVRQFLHLSHLDKEEVLASEKLLQQGFYQIPMKENHRSLKEIIRFNNEWFKFRLESFENNRQIVKAYQDFEQNETPRTKSGGGICIWLHEKTKMAIYEESILQQTLQAIRECHDDGKFAYAQIAVLTRSNTLGAKIAQFLISNQIPVISSESLLLSQSPEVRFIIQCISYIQQPNNPISKALILYQLAQWKKEDNPEKYLARAATIQSFNQVLAEWDININADEWKYLNLYELFQNILQTFAPWLSYELPHSGNPFVMALGEIIWDFQGKANKKEADFIAFWDENKGKLSLTNPENIDAVHIMSIHKSKGLEFPIIIYPMKKDKSGYTQSRQWVDLTKEDLPIKLNAALLELNDDLSHTSYADLVATEADMTQLDNLNLEYVAFTRAKQRLYLIAQKPSPLEKFLTEKCNLNGIAEKENITRYNYPSNAKFSNNEEFVQIEKVTLPFSPLKKRKLPPLALKYGQNSPEAERGTLIHQCLSMLYRPADKDWITAFIQKSNNISDSDKSFLLQLLDNIIRENSSLLFGDEQTQVFTEKEIIDENGEVHRFDRLLKYKNHYRLMDYKTGQENSSHIKQMETYLRLLKQTDSEANAEAFILYIHDDASIEIKKLPLQS